MELERSELEALQIDTKDEADFNRALKMVALANQGTSWEKAAEEVGLKPATRFTPRWKRLISRAQNYTNQAIEQSHKVAVTIAFDNFADMVREQVRIATKGRLERDRIEAYKALFISVIQPNLQLEHDGTGEEQYAKSTHSFSPMRDILKQIAENGADIRVSIPKTINADE